MQRGTNPSYLASLSGLHTKAQAYLFNFLYCSDGQQLLLENITGAAQGGLNSSNLKAIKIPLPDDTTLKHIVKECDHPKSDIPIGHGAIFWADWRLTARICL